MTSLQQQRLDAGVNEAVQFLRERKVGDILNELLRQPGTSVLASLLEEMVSRVVSAADSASEERTVYVACRHPAWPDPLSIYTFDEAALWFERHRAKFPQIFVKAVTTRSEVMLRGSEAGDA